MQSVPRVISRIEFETRLFRRRLPAFLPIVGRRDRWIQENENRYKGQRCFIIGNGPSLNDLDLSLIKDEVTFGTNGVYHISEEIDLTFFVYVSTWWYENHIEGIKNVHCQRRFIPTRFTCLESERATSWLNVIYPIQKCHSGPFHRVPNAFSMNPSRLIYAGGSVTFLSLQLAYFLGFESVVMIGFDHSYNKQTDAKANAVGGTFIQADKGSHFRQDYMPENKTYHVDLDGMENGYRMALKRFSSDGRTLVNATPGSALEIIPKVSYKDLFC